MSASLSQIQPYPQAELTEQQSGYLNSLLKARAFWREVPDFREGPMVQVLNDVDAVPFQSAPALLRAMEAAEWHPDAQSAYVSQILNSRRDLLLRVLIDGEETVAVRYLRQHPVTTALETFGTTCSGQGLWRGTLQWYLAHLGQEDMERSVNFGTFPSHHRMQAVGRCAGFSLQSTDPEDGTLWFTTTVRDLIGNFCMDPLPEQRSPIVTGQKESLKTARGDYFLHVDFFGLNPYLLEATLALRDGGKEALTALVERVRSSQLK